MRHLSSIERHPRVSSSNQHQWSDSSMPKNHGLSLPSLPGWPRSPIPGSPNPPSSNGNTSRCYLTWASPSHHPILTPLAAPPTCLRPSRANLPPSKKRGPTKTNQAPTQPCIESRGGWVGHTKRHPPCPVLAINPQHRPIANQRSVALVSKSSNSSSNIGRAVTSGMLQT